MKETPMMKQFNSFKRKYPNKILLFRMGDFFETFGDDAKIASKVLNITLTSRDKKQDPTPMAGFPHHALNQYLPKFVKSGYCVVVVDQLENPKFAKGLVKRGVARIVTPGTLEEDESSYVKNINLVALAKVKNTLGVAIMDISTGNMKVCDCAFSVENVQKIINSFDPGEILLLEDEKEIGVFGKFVQFLEKDCDYEKTLKEFFKVRSLNALSLKKNLPSWLCAGLIIKYVIDTQKTNPDHISVPEFFNIDGTMYLDSSTIKNLDLVFNSSTGSTQGSLISILDCTKTNMGKRALYSWLLNPLLDFVEVSKRLKIVEYLFQKADLLQAVRNLLGGVNDLERIVGRIGLNRANARDYKALEYSLLEVEKLLDVLKEFNKKFGVFSKELFSSKQENSLKELIEEISKVLADELPISITEGGIIRDGFDSKVDELRSISCSSKDWVKEFVIQEKKKTGISNLKIGFNKVFGYYLEVSKLHQSKVPSEYIRKQTLANCERYITEELKEKEDEILNAEGKLSDLEFKIFQDFREKTLVYIENIKKIALEIAYLDVLQGFAYCSFQNDYVKPKVFEKGNEGRIIDVKQARHPVIEVLGDEDFVSNDIFLNDELRRMNILTGPNMSGKSTYIRQVALCVLMSQLGCFVPATSASITMVDRIFTRVGASDDLIRGRSTFMVEMDEASNIINNATQESLVILDEIGRGTSTYDGVSIAWALAEYLVKNIKARTMFATHYHELLALSESNPENVTNLSVQVEENEEEVVFLRKIVEGGTDRSYGIYVAKLAGLPEVVINRAYEILASFEQTAMFSKKNISIPIQEIIKKEETEEKQLSLFPNKSDKLLRELNKLEIEKLAPIDALNKLNEWKKKYLN